jgi:hypothetical protein
MPYEKGSGERRSQDGRFNRTMNTFRTLHIYSYSKFYKWFFSEAFDLILAFRQFSRRRVLGTQYVPARSRIPQPARPAYANVGMKPLIDLENRSWAEISSLMRADQDYSLSSRQPLPSFSIFHLRSLPINYLLWLAGERGDDGEAKNDEYGFPSCGGEGKAQTEAGSR